jgi:RAB protein geranylgeranyltransferase component A
LSGSLPESQSQANNLQVNTNELIPGGYYATISITSNDPNNPEIEIPVTLDVITSINEYQNSGIQLFPNPAKDEVFVQSKYSIDKVRMLSLLGEVLMEKDFADSEIRLDISKLKPGVYIVEIETWNGKAVRKLVVE